MINEIEIVEYKGFKNLKLDNLSQINIISGENNVGKTALLEALFIYNYINFWNPFLSYDEPFLFIAKNRDITENRMNRYLTEANFIAKSKERDISIHYKSSYYLTKEEKIKVKEKFNKDYKEFLVTYINNDLDIIPIDNINLNNIYNASDNIYINSSKPTNKNLVELYSHIQSKGI